MHRKVDPAALLIAVVAVGIPPLLAPGEWGKLNTIVAGVVGAILVIFTWPRKDILLDELDQKSKPDYWIPIGQAIAYGLVIAIGAAWPIQQYWPHPPKCTDTLPKHCQTGDQLSELATYRAMWVGLVSATILSIAMIWRIKKLSDRTPPRPKSNTVIILLFPRRPTPIRQFSSHPARRRKATIYRKRR
jgi:hypothetical protein